MNTLESVFVLLLFFACIIIPFVWLSRKKISRKDEEQHVFGHRCPECGAYNNKAIGSSVVHTSPDGGDCIESSLQFRCRKCKHEWWIDQIALMPVERASRNDEEKNLPE